MQRLTIELSVDGQMKMVCIEFETLQNLDDDSFWYPI
jgi:hypothetical protein